MKRVNQIFNGLEKVLNVVLAASILAMVALLIYQTVMRYVFRHPPIWCEEMCVYLFCYNTLLGATVGIRKLSHLQVDVLTSRYSEKIQEIVGIIISVVMIVFFVLFTKYSISLMQVATGTSVTMPFIIMKYIYFAFPLGGVLIIIFSVEDIFRRIAKLGGKTPINDEKEVIEQ